MTRERVENSTPSNHGKPWSTEQVKLLNHYFVDNNLSIRTIAEKLGRKQSGIVGKLHTAGLIKLKDFKSGGKDYFKQFESTFWGSLTKVSLDALYNSEGVLDPNIITIPIETNDIPITHTTYNGYFNIKRNLIVDNLDTQCNNTNSNNTGESKMRRVVNVQVIDDDKGLPVELSLVAEFKNIVTEDDNDAVIREVLMSGEEYEPDGMTMAKLLVHHNEIRQATVNEDILNRTGNEVRLRPVKLKDLRFKVV